MRLSFTDTEVSSRKDLGLGIDSDFWGQVKSLITMPLDPPSPINPP